MKAKVCIFMACLYIFLSLGYSQENEGHNEFNAPSTKDIIFAEKTYQRSLSSLGEKHPETLKIMNNLAGMYYYRLDYKKAELLFLKSFQVTKEILGEKHPETLRIMNNLAGMYHSQGIYDKAESFLVKVLELRRELLGEKHPETLGSMNNLGFLYYSQGKYDKAEPLYVKTLELREKVLGEKHPDTFISLNNLAQLYVTKGEYSRAESFLVKVLELRRSVLGEKHPETLTLMNSLASLYTSQGEYSRAEPLYLKTLELERKILGKKHPSTLAVMNNLAGLYELQGKYRKSSLLYEETLHLAIEILGEQHPNTLKTMNNLAWVYQLQGEHQKVEPLLVKALQLTREALEEKHPDTLILMNNLAEQYKLQGKYEEAEQLNLKTLQLTREVQGGSHPNTLRSMKNLAGLYYEQRKHGSALSILKEHLVKKCLYLKRELLGNSEKTRLSMLEQFNVDSDKNNLFSTLEEYPKGDFDSLALYFSVNYKGILLQISRELKQAFHNVTDQDLLKDLLEKRSSYSRLSLNYEKRTENRASVEKLEKEIDELEKKLIWQNSDFKDLISDVKVDEVKKNLLENELLIDFVVYRSFIREKTATKLVAVVVEKNNIRLVKLGDFEDTGSLIQNYRGKIQNKEVAKELPQKIYERILSPLTRYWQGKKKVYIVPDGVLHLLPFRSLIDEKGQYLVESKNIIILSSSRDLVKKKTEKSNEFSAIFAYPNYGKGLGKKIVEKKKIWFSPLKGTLAESKNIQKILRIPTKVYTQDQATEENISKINSPQILHIATHGYFLDAANKSKSKNQGAFISERASPISSGRKLTNPLVYSGLAFTGANDPEKDGVLTALEVLGLNLLGTDLVVLSACETGVGEIRQGEGVYSLQRAFREAGAKSVLATLWKVDDQATQLFMEKFYQRYMRGDSPQKAVRDTQLEFLKSKRYSHPFYWSSFVMIGGDSDDMEQENRVVIEKKEQGSIIPFILLGVIILIIVFLVLAHKKKEKRLLEERMAKRKRRREKR